MIARVDITQVSGQGAGVVRSVAALTESFREIAEEFQASRVMQDLGDTMKTVEEVLQKRYEVSAGKARVARDMVDIEKVTEKENERKALEQVALAEFLASQGIQATPAAESQAPAAAKEIGPQQ